MSKLPNTATPNIYTPSLFSDSMFESYLSHILITSTQQDRTLDALAGLRGPLPLSNPSSPPAPCLLAPVAPSHILSVAVDDSANTAVAPASVLGSAAANGGS